MILGSRGWDADCGNDCEGSASIFFARQVDQGDLPRAETVAESRPESHPLGRDFVPYERAVQPRPKLGQWTAALDELLETNAAKPAREQLTLIRIFEELRGRGYGGGYDAVRRYARRWAKERGQSTAAAYVPLSFAPGEAFQFDSHGGPRVKSFRCSTVRFCRTPVSMGTSGFDPSGRFRPVRMSPFAVGGENGERETGVKDAQHRRSRHARSACP